MSHRDILFVDNKRKAELRASGTGPNAGPKAFILTEIHPGGRFVPIEMKLNDKGFNI
ncbi:MAG: hypothetical protein QM802_23315 [Agriterribacter sp.]